MKRSIGAIVIIGIVVVSLAVAIWAGPRPGGLSPAAAGEQIGLIRVEGAIMSGESGGSLMGGAVAGSDTLVDQLDQAAEAPSIKAVLMRINSPGGSVVATWEVGEAMKRVKAAGKPIVVSMSEAAASGGYWLATYADKIVATPATTTGSIGVIMELTDLQEIYEKVGYKTITFKSGAHKDMGSPTRDLDEEERAMIQSMVDQMYEDFVQRVAEGRSMDPAKVREIADGRIILGADALDLGLVDELGDMKRAVELTEELANLPGEPQVIEIGTGGSFFDSLLGGSSSVSTARQLLGWLLLGSSDLAPREMSGAQALEPNLVGTR